MNQPAPVNTAIKPTNLFLRIAIIVIAIGATGFGTWYYLSKSGNSSQAGPTIITHSLKDTADVPPVTPPDMKAEFDSKLLHITNGDTSGLWPVKTAYPLPGALLPYKRILAFYGNLYSKQMGILGELPPDQMLQKLQEEVKAWQAADTIIEVVPALHYIAVTAQQAPGKGGKHRLRMPFHQIDSILSLAKRINALVFIDIQVGLSTLQQEIPELVNYLKMPHVHLGIDPEFSMKGGHAPGKVVGTFDAADINYAAEYLAKLVKENNLPPKVLVIHRFTRNMVTNTRQIRTRPEVQLVMDMDGWGGPQLKFNTYRQFIYRDPVEFTGFKLFYKNDTKNNNRLLTPAEVLALKPQPVYIQYQ
jgi:hypothetical protein